MGGGDATGPVHWVLLFGLVVSCGKSSPDVDATGDGEPRAGTPDAASPRQEGDPAMGGTTSLASPVRVSPADTAPAEGDSPSPDGTAGVSSTESPSATGDHGGSASDGGFATPGTGDSSTTSNTAPCEAGLALLHSVPLRRAASYASGVGVLVTFGQPSILLYDLPSPWDDGDVPEESIIDVDALGWSTDASLTGLATNEDTLAVSGESVAVLPLAAGGEVRDIGCPLSECRGVVLGPTLLAVTDGSALALARMENGDWVWEDTVPAEQYPLAIDGDEVLLARSGGYFYDEETGNNLPVVPGIVKLSAEREVVAGFETCGTPRRPARVGGGWLFPETYTDTGYCWDYLEWLSPEGQLRPLAEVVPEPDPSADDRFEKGAYAAAELDGNVYVAACEHGLLRGQWSTTGIHLAPVGPSRDGCVRNVVAAGEVLTVETPDSLDFVRPCE